MNTLQIQRKMQKPFFVPTPTVIVVILQTNWESLSRVVGKFQVNFKRIYKILIEISSQITNFKF
jgi:hypothetical protein